MINQYVGCFCKITSCMIKSGYQECGNINQFHSHTHISAIARRGRPTHSGKSDMSNRKTDNARDPPEGLDPEDITRPGRPDDAGIDMPGNARGVEGWLERLGLTGSGIGETAQDAAENLRLYPVGGGMRLELDERMADNTVDIFDTYGRTILTMADRTSYTFTLPRRAVYLLSVTYGPGNRRANRKFMF